MWLMRPDVIVCSLVLEMKLTSTLYRDKKVNLLILTRSYASIIPLPDELGEAFHGDDCTKKLLMG